MYSFKVRACSRAYSHDWTECPFVHPGENARRRDPRKYHYSCVPCPEFKKGAGCRRGDMCEYAHGVFESWLHPAQYRTRLCKDGVGCARRVCFFAHTPEELRPLYVSTGSAVPGKNLVPSNLDDLFSAELAAASRSPRYADQGGAAFSPTRKAAVLNQFQQQQQSLLSPRAAAVAPEPVSPMSSRLLAALAQREKMQQHTLRSMSSRDLAAGASLLVGSPVSSSMSKWGFPSGNPDWGADDEELGRLKRCSSFELRSGANGSHEPDLSWVNTLVKEPTPEKPSVHRTTITTAAMDSIGILGQTTSREHIVGEEDTAGVISSWLEQLQLDEMVV
uniref:C3H1-type domain-containing protein n=1 Tax=Oryza brachyantha TaxID=4533 RepID=J3NDT2_ORYBR